MTFGTIDEAVAAYLRRTGKTQAELAEELGMSENSLSWKRRDCQGGGVAMGEAEAEFDPMHPVSDSAGEETPDVAPVEEVSDDE